MLITFLQHPLYLMLGKSDFAGNIRLCWEHQVSSVLKDPETGRTHLKKLCKMRIRIINLNYNLFLHVGPRDTVPYLFVSVSSAHHSKVMIF